MSFGTQFDSGQWSGTLYQVLGGVKMHHQADAEGALWKEKRLLMSVRFHWRRGAEFSHEHCVAQKWSGSLRERFSKKMWSNTFAKKDFLQQQFPDTAQQRETKTGTAKKSASQQPKGFKTWKKLPLLIVSIRNFANTSKFSHIFWQSRFLHCQDENFHEKLNMQELLFLRKLRELG